MAREEGVQVSDPQQGCEQCAYGLNIASCQFFRLQACNGTLTRVARPPSLWPIPYSALQTNLCSAALQALKKVQASVEKGSFWQQFSAVLALRMTPVLPFRWATVLYLSDPVCKPLVSTVQLGHCYLATVLLEV